MKGSVNIRWVVKIVLLVCWGISSPALAYDVAEVVNGSTISGRVSYSGTPPAPKLFEVEKDPEVCGQERAVTEVIARGGYLKGVVVVLEGVTKGKPFHTQYFEGEPPGQGEFRYTAGKDLSLEVRTKGCSFGPLTGVVAPNQPVQFVNHDPMKHTLHSFAVSGKKGHILRTIHNRNLIPQTTTERTFHSKKLRNSHIVRLACNRHDFMENWLYVVETPYYSITDENGNFTIGEVPPGHYRLVAWHPVLGQHVQEVHATPEGHIQVTFGFSER